VEPVQYPYSLKFSAATLLVLLTLMLVLLNSVVGQYNLLIWVVYGFIALVFISLGAVLILKRLAPALRGDVALQIDDEGISDFVKDVSIRWSDIEEVRFTPGRSAGIIWVDLKWESDYGSHIAIYLRWIKGRDRDIYSTVLSYLDQYHSSFQR
jgi:hypothetical protein